MNFKIGDVVIVSKPDKFYEQYKGKVGTILHFDDTYWHVDFKNEKQDCFNPWEIELAKSHIINAILNDL